MTNRQWLAGLSTDNLVEFLVPLGCPSDYTADDCPEIDCPEIDCIRCWAIWLDQKSNKPTTAIYDVVEEHHGCMVQVLKNSVTGEMSVGWMKE